MKKIFIWGVHGVGKSTVIKDIIKEDSKIWYYSFGENVRNIWIHTGILKSPADLVTLQYEQRMYLMGKAKEMFIQLISSEIYDMLLIDNHFSVYQDNKLVQAIDDDEAIYYDKFVLIEVPSNILRERILQDNKQRIKEAFQVSKIEDHLKYERSVAINLKQRLWLDFYMVQNIILSDTIQKIKEFISWS